jgi:DNA invertase Pin-like site-specific DNA recombinase
VTRLDRLARSTRDLLNTLAAITGKNYGEEALSVVHSLNLRSALGLFF